MPADPGRHAQWEDAKVEIQQHFTDRFDYTAKTERVAEQAEEHFQDATTDRGIMRSQLGLDSDDLSQDGQDKVLNDYQADVKAAFDDRFGTPGDRYDTAVDHVTAFHGRLDTFARDLPARLDREALWEQQRGLTRQRFDEVFDSHPVVAPRRELFGPRGSDRIEAQRTEAWQRLEPELRNVFDETAAHASPTDLAAAVSARFDEMLRGEIPDGIALHDRLLTEVSAGRAAAGDGHSAADDTIKQRITSEFESVFGKPFAARPDDGRPPQDDFSARDRWAELEYARHTDWLPKAVALDKELSSGFADRFDTVVGSRAEPRAELGLNLERPVGYAAHGLTYDTGVGHPSAESGADGHDGADVENPSGPAPKTEEAWLPGRDVSDAGLDRVRATFAGELAAAFREHFDGTVTGDGDGDRETAWQDKRDALFATRLPELLEYEAGYERQLNNASRDFEDSFDEWAQDFAGGGHLDDDGLDRVRATFDRDFRDAYDQVHRADPDRWTGAGGPERAWQAVSRRLLGSADQRFEAEEALVNEVRRAADRFDRLGGEFEVEDQHAQELGSAYRTDTATRYDQVFGDGTRDLTAWLEHEKENGDAFGTRLTDLGDQREAAAARAEAERSAAAAHAAQAAHSAEPTEVGAGHHGEEDAGQQVQTAHEQPPPETGPEKLQRLSAENDAKVEGDMRQLTRLWQEKGHSDTLIEQAAKSWTDTVRKEFDSFHRSLADDNRVPTGGKWEDTYDNLLDIGTSEQWIGAHKQVGEAMAVLEDGLKQRTEEWSGSRYADWQRDQLADAGRRLTSQMRSELTRQLRYLQVSPADAVANDTRRQWTADAITKGFDGVLSGLGRDIDTSPVVMATLATLRTETVSALDPPGHALYLDEEAVTDAGGASAAERWQQTRTQLDTRYAEQLDVLAKLESKRPDADAVFARIVDAGRDQRHEGLEDYEQMLPDSAKFRQAFDETFDQAFAPLVHARPGGSGPGTARAQQQWNERRELLENTLASRVRLAAKHAELTELAARTAQTTRDKWISERAADEKIVDQELEGFRANHERLFLGTYGRLDSSGNIDVNASSSYQDAYRSLVGNLDKQLAAAMTQDSAEQAASSRYDEAVHAWRQSHGPTLSSFEPGMTVAFGYPPPEAEFAQAPFAKDPEARFEAAFAAQAASASARHLDQLRREMIDAARSAEEHQTPYAATGRAPGGRAAVERKLDLEGQFVEAMPRLRDAVAEAVRTSGGLDERAAESLLTSSVVRADAVFQRIAQRAADAADAGPMLHRELQDVIAGTKAVAEFQAAVSERVRAFAESSADPLPAQAGARVVQWAYGAAASKFDQLLASGRHSGGTRIAALSRGLDETLTEVDGRLGFEAAAQKAISSATEKAARIAEERLRASRTVLDPDSVQRLRLRHGAAAQQAAEKVRGDLAAHHFDPGHTRQVIGELDGRLRQLVDGVPEQVLVETDLTSALTDAGNRFAALTDAYAVPVRVFAGPARDYRRDYVTAHIRTFSVKPLDVPSWLEHEASTADRFNAALHAPVREVDLDWQLDERDDESPWRKSTFSPVGADAACVEAVPVDARRPTARGAIPRPISPRPARTPVPRHKSSPSIRPRRPATGAGPFRIRAALSAYPAPPGAVREWIKSVTNGILETVDVLFIDGTDVPVKHKYADRMVVLRGAGEAESPGLYYTADEWQAFLLGVKEGEFDDMASGTQPSDGAERVIALRDSKDPDGPKLILAFDAWADLLVTIKAGERELPSDMRELLDGRFH